MTFVSFVRYHFQVLVKRYYLNKPITNQQQFNTFKHVNAVKTNLLQFKNKHQNREKRGVKWPWTWRIWFAGGSVGIFTTSPRTSLSFTKNHSKKRKFPGEQQLWGGNCLANVRGQRSDHNKGDRKWPNCWFQATQHLCSVKTLVQTLNLWLLFIIETSIMSLSGLVFHKKLLSKLLQMQHWKGSCPYHTKLSWLSTEKIPAHADIKNNVKNVIKSN